ncbi:MAG TPA: crosslink repair DNA glycosylase YcaQ family protein [Micromonosporaceae bacterium]|nr:crosslink repair DNA glycosylase YcaQ family protein [Micromonosporaceae bacterium]
MTDLRAWWWHRQGLDGSLDGEDPATVLARTGWARSVGGANPYLTLFARAGVHRAEVDAAVADLAVHELPSARGCTYVVPAADFGLALQVGRSAPEADLARVAKLGVPRGEIDELRAAVLDAVAAGPLDPVALKDVLGDAVRNLGAAGKKQGVSTTLPVALGLLQASGDLRRIPVGGRLDQQRYSYARWDRPDSGLSDDAARVSLVRRYLGWTGGAGVAHVRWFTGFTARVVKAALAELAPVEVAEGVLALPADAKAFAEFVAPARPRYALLGGIDGLFLLRRDLSSLLDDGSAPVPGEDRTIGQFTDLPDHAIVDRGRLVGLWQFDVDSSRIVWWTWDPALATDPDLVSEVERTAAYIRDELGDARGFSLDSPKSRAPRIAALSAAVRR